MMLTFDVSFDTSGATVSGEKFWEVQMFTNSESDGRGKTCASSEMFTVNGDVTNVGSTMLVGLDATLNLSQCDCEEVRICA